MVEIIIKLAAEGGLNCYLLFWAMVNLNSCYTAGSKLTLHTEFNTIKEQEKPACYILLPTGNH